MRRAADIALGLAPPRPGETLQAWLYRELREAILGARLLPGVLLPPSRDLARQQGISRGTVQSVYESLQAEGFVTARPGQGTRVARALTGAEPPGEQGVKTGVPLAPQPGRLSDQGQRLAASPFPRLNGGLPRAFQPNYPDVAAFPRALWQRGLARRTTALTDADPLGDPALREALAEHLRTSLRLDCQGSHIALVASAQQGLDLCGRLLLDPGDPVWMEDPGYPGAARVLAAAGGRLVPVPVDAEGLRVDLGRARAPDARLAYVTAGHQAPLGMALSLERRLALLAWADAQGATVIEDDYDGEFRFAGRPLTPVKSLDASGRVVYLGTFSKLLFPALRLAYLVLPDWLVEPMAGALALTSRYLSPLPQAALLAFMEAGHFHRHLRRMRLLYGERAAALEAACRRTLAGGLELLPVHTGMDATALLPGFTPGADREVVAALAARGVSARPLSWYAQGTLPPAGLVLGFGAFSESAIRAGVDTLAAVLDGWPQAGGTAGASDQSGPPGLGGEFAEVGPVFRRKPGEVPEAPAGGNVLDGCGDR